MVEALKAGKVSHYEQKILTTREKKTDKEKSKFFLQKNMRLNWKKKVVIESVF